MGKVISLESRRRDHVRRRDIGQGGNGGKFASILRAEPGIAVLDDEIPVSEMPEGVTLLSVDPFLGVQSEDVQRVRDALAAPATAH